MDLANFFVDYLFNIIIACMQFIAMLPNVGSENWNSYYQMQ